MARRNHGSQQPKPAIADQDRKFMEEAIRSLPKTAQHDGEGAFADRLLNYGYHTNPYVRAFTSVLWSGYAISRGQVVDADARFRKAREDAELSNVDRTTVTALESAHTALQESLAPSGSVATFLDELRQRTIQRMWARVCETAMLPPPSFSRLLAEDGDDAMSEQEMEAAELAEIHAMMKNPPTAATQSDDDDGDDGYDDDFDEDVQAKGDDDSGRTEQRGGDNDRGGEGDSSEPAETALAISVVRSGGADAGAELVLQAAAEVVKQLRLQGASGGLEVTISVTGAGTGKKSSGRRRRGRRRN